MNDVRVSQSVISKTNNGTSVLFYFNVGTVSQTVRSGNGPYKEKHHTRPALLTVLEMLPSGPASKID